MSLPVRQQRALDGIEGVLKASEPRMAAMFAIFTRLTQDDGPAITERLARSRTRVSAGLRAFVLIPVVFAMLITGAVISGNGHGASGCGARLAGYGPAGRSLCGRLGAVSPAVAGKSARPSEPAKPGKPAGPVTPLISRSFSTQLPGVLQMR